MKKRSMRIRSTRVVIFILTLLLITPVAIYTYRIVKIDKNRSTNIFGDPISEPTTSTNQIKIPTSTTANVESESAIEIPSSKTIFVPYARQAPFSIWDALHEDACEEASLLMIKHFKDGTPINDKQAIDNEIIELVKYEGKNGYGPSIALSDLKNIASSQYGMKGTIVDNPTIDDMKREIAAGNPFIIPADGKLLPNPYFRNGGPIYHMLVVKGYDGTNFVTNDPGTMKGDGFLYPYDKLMTAIHDWNPSNILNGKKAYLVFR